jgi:endonuclease/exonuclease/phosphatase family metal-dependent hydrolase
VRLISWNVAGRKAKQPAQAAQALAERPDLLALQEVTAGTVAAWRSALADELPHIVDTGAVAGSRRYFNLLASRWPLDGLPATRAPFPERLLAASVATPAGTLEIHVAHLPTGVGHGWKKIETFEALFERLADPATTEHRLLCGDFNSPKHEAADGGVTTFGVHRPRAFERWDAGERSVITGLAEHDLADAFRQLHGYGRVAHSWVWRNQIGRRFDHVFASASLAIQACEYREDWRTSHLSDHAAIVADFAPTQRASN